MVYEKGRYGWAAVSDAEILYRFAIPSPLSPSLSENAAESFMAVAPKLGGVAGGYDLLSICFSRHSRIYRWWRAHPFLRM